MNRKIKLTLGFIGGCFIGSGPIAVERPQPAEWEAPLKEAGYTGIHINGKRWDDHGCNRLSTIWPERFIATDHTQRTVTGSVCSGPFKKLTVVLD